jgi:hypothetical protein
MNDNNDPSFTLSFVLGKILASLLMAWLITTYSLPFWAAALLIFLA